MKTHRTDLVSLVPGLLLVVVGLGALTDNLDIDLVTADWAWPALLVALGLVVLASAGRRRGDDAPDDGVAAEAATTTDEAATTTDEAREHEPPTA